MMNGPREASARVSKIGLRPYKSPIGEERFVNEQLSQPFIEAKIRSCLHGIDKVGFVKSGGYLDRKLAIDGIVKFINGMTSSFQSKVLSYEYAHHKTVTVEYYNNPETKDPGDWFHCIAQLYFCGYWTEDGQDIMPWRLLDWCLVQQMTAEGRIIWRILPNSKTNARANFRYTYMDDLPQLCVLGGQDVLG